MLSEWKQFESRMSGLATRRKPVRVADALVAKRCSTVRCSRSMSRSWWSNLPAKGKSLAVGRVVVARWYRADVVRSGVDGWCRCSASFQDRPWPDHSHKLPGRRFQSDRGSRPRTNSDDERAISLWLADDGCHCQRDDVGPCSFGIRDSGPPLRRGPILLSFGRTIELRASQWSDLYLDNLQWKVPARRMIMREALAHSSNPGSRLIRRAASRKN